ncbi:hypothetical protein ACFC5I_10730 [Enterococcus faecalis]
MKMLDLTNLNSGKGEYMMPIKEMEISSEQVIDQLLKKITELEYENAALKAVLSNKDSND